MYGIRTTDCIITQYLKSSFLPFELPVLNDIVTKAYAICPCIHVQATMCVFVMIITMFPEAMYGNAAKSEIMLIEVTNVR